MASGDGRSIGNTDEDFAADRLRFCGGRAANDGAVATTMSYSRV